MAPVAPPSLHSICIHIPLDWLTQDAIHFSDFKQDAYKLHTRQMLHFMCRVAFENTDRVRFEKEKLCSADGSQLYGFRLWLHWDTLKESDDLSVWADAYIGFMKRWTAEADKKETHENKEKTDEKEPKQTVLPPFPVLQTKEEWTHMLKQLFLCFLHPDPKYIEVYFGPKVQFSILAFRPNATAIDPLQRTVNGHRYNTYTYPDLSRVYTYSPDEIRDFWHTSIYLERS